MKYADSFEHTETMTASGTTYSPWFDISWANELYVHWDSTEDGDFSVVMTLERSTPYRTFTTKTVSSLATVATTTANEAVLRHADDGAALADDQKLGMRVCFKYVCTRTSGTSMIIYSTIYAKRN